MPSSAIVNIAQQPGHRRESGVDPGNEVGFPANVDVSWRNFCLQLVKGFQLVSTFELCFFLFLWGKARTLASTEGFIYLFVRGFACVTWSSAKEPEAGDGKENEREPGDEVAGACRVEIGHIGFWRVVSCGFFLYCLKTVAGDSKDYGDVS